MNRPPRVLLTGATGFIGRHVFARLKRDGVEVIPVGRRDPQPPEAGFLRCDLSSPESAEALRSVEPDVVIHLAARMPEASAAEEPLKASLHANVEATANLALACPAAKYFVYLSTVDVYGGPEYLPIDERHPTEPTTYYGAAKLAAEKLLGVHCRRAGIGLLTLRLTQTYGPGEPPVKVIPQAIARAAAGQSPTLFGDGSDLRDYIHVSDVAEAIARALQMRPTGVANLASGTSRKVADVVDTVLRVAGHGMGPTVLPRQKPCVHLAFDVSRAGQMLGTWKLKDFEEGVREQYEAWVQASQGHS